MTVSKGLRAAVGTIVAVLFGAALAELLVREQRARSQFDRSELWAVATLPGGQHECQQLLAVLADQMQLGRQPATRATQRVVIGFLGHAAGRFYLQVPFLRAPAACWWALATVESTDTSQPIALRRPRVPAGRSRSAAMCRHVASGGTANRWFAMAHSGRGHPATARPCGSASGSRRSTGGGCAWAVAPGRPAWAATAPRPPTRRRSDRRGRPRVGCPIEVSVRISVSWSNDSSTGDSPLSRTSTPCHIPSPTATPPTTATTYETRLVS